MDREVSIQPAGSLAIVADVLLEVENRRSCRLHDCAVGMVSRMLPRRHFVNGRAVTWHQIAHVRRVLALTFNSMSWNRRGSQDVVPCPSVILSFDQVGFKLAVYVQVAQSECL